MNRLKFFYWNARGIANPETRLVLKNFCLSYNPDLVFIAEPWILISQIPNGFWQSLNLKVFSVNNRENLAPNLWVICSISMQFCDLTVLAISDQYISLSLVLDRQLYFISTIYASTSHYLRRQLWLDLASLQQNNQGPWCFLGDFNAILGAHEKRGSNPPMGASCDEFKAWTDSCSLTHIDTRGALYTWTTRRGISSLIELRLDRAISYNEWMDFWDSIACCTLTRSHSDHHPLLLIVSKGAMQFPSSFKFFNMWLEHEDCRRLVTEVWNRSVPNIQFGPMQVVSKKLSALKCELKAWNREVFGDVKIKVDNAMKR